MSDEPAPEGQIWNPGDVASALWLGDIHNKGSYLPKPIDRCIGLDDGVILFWCSMDPRAILAFGPFGTIISGIGTFNVNTDVLSNVDTAREGGSIQMAIDTLQREMARRTAEQSQDGDNNS